MAFITSLKTGFEIQSVGYSSSFGSSSSSISTCSETSTMMFALDNVLVTEISKSVSSIVHELEPKRMSIWHRRLEKT